MRLTIFLLLFSLSAQGQFIIDSYRFGGGAPAGLLLDDFSGANLAVSLRLLRTAYTGDAIVVRRSSNNDTLAIGFSGNYLDTTALKTFCGTGATDTCFVRRWYDQSGSGNDLIKTTDSAQPKILTSGIVERYNGNVVLNFDGTTDNLTRAGYTSLSVSSNFAIVYYLKVNVSGNNYIINVANNTNDRVNMTDRILTLTNTGVNTGRSHGTLTATGSLLFAENSPQELYRNNNISAFTTTVGAFNSTTLSIGGRPDDNTSNNANILAGEIIIYPSNQSSNRTAIETNINNFYQIY